MHRRVTAVYRTHTAAARVRQALAEIGIPDDRIHGAPSVFAPLGPLGMRVDLRLMEAVQGLALPVGDARAYQDSVLRGDYVVSVDVASSEVAGVIDLMRRPEDTAPEEDGPETAPVDPPEEASGWFIDLAAYRRRRRLARRQARPAAERRNR
jgi:hypothetical protein